MTDDELADELLDLVDDLYKATQHAVALLHRLQATEARMGPPRARSGAKVLTFPSDDLA